MGYDAGTARASVPTGPDRTTVLAFLGCSPPPGVPSETARAVVFCPGRFGSLISGLGLFRSLHLCDKSLEGGQEGSWGHLRGDGVRIGCFWCDLRLVDMSPQFLGAHV